MDERFPNSGIERPDRYHRLRKLASFAADHFWGGIHAIGTENLPQTDGSFFVVPNHDSYLDIPVVGHTIYEATGRYTHFMAKKELWNFPLLGSRIGDYLETAGAFPIDRSKEHAAQDAVTEKIGELVRQNAVVAIFAQGSRHTHKVGEVGDREVKTGSIFWAMENGVDVYPAGISGTSDLRMPTISYRPAIPVEKRDIKGASRSEFREIAAEAKQIRQVLTDEMRLGISLAEVRRKEMLESLPPRFLSKTILF